MDITGHITAVKTETSIKTDYTLGTGDDWIAHGAYINRTIQVSERYYVRARVFDKSDSLRQFSVRFTCTDGAEYTEHFFHFAGAEFIVTDQYIDLQLDTRELVDLAIVEIALFGNATDRDDFEVDCFYVENADRDGTVLYEAENMNTVDIGRKTATSVIAAYETQTENEWLIWGGYINYSVNSQTESLTVRCRIFNRIQSPRILTVKLVCSDSTEYYYDIPSSAFYRIGSYIDYVIPTDNINGKTVCEIVAFGNLALPVKAEIDCFCRCPVQRLFDANNDGLINIKDLIRIKKYLTSVLGGADIVFKNCDCNFDGAIDSLDMIMFRNCLLRK